MSNTHNILFTGHMIDKHDRKHPRFPASKEAAVQEGIRKAVAAEKNRIKGPVTGIAAGACGGDILFHEVCREMNISTEMFLGLPPEDFIKESVAFAGQDWVDRFWDIYKNGKHPVMPGGTDIFINQKDKIWEKANLWMMDNAMANGGSNMSLIALWDGKGGDGPGGTEHMVNTAKAQGARTVIIDISQM